MPVGLADIMQQTPSVMPKDGNDELSTLPWTDTILYMHDVFKINVIIMHILYPSTHKRENGSKNKFFPSPW